MKKYGKINIKAFIVTAIVAAVSFLRIFSVNVVFDRCLNNDEVATAMQKSSFRSYQYVHIDGNGTTLSMTDNSQIYGKPLEGIALENALAERKTYGTAVIDGGASLLDIIRIKLSPFVYKVIIYFPILDGGDRDILPRSTDYFYKNSPEARCWE